MKRNTVVILIALVMAVIIAVIAAMNIRSSKNTTQVAEEENSLAAETVVEAQEPTIVVATPEPIVVPVVEEPVSLPCPVREYNAQSGSWEWRFYGSVDQFREWSELLPYNELYYLWDVEYVLADGQLVRGNMFEYINVALSDGSYRDYSLATVAESFYAEYQILREIPRAERAIMAVRQNTWAEGIQTSDLEKVKGLDDKAFNNAFVNVQVGETTRRVLKEQYVTNMLYPEAMTMGYLSRWILDSEGNPTSEDGFIEAYSFGDAHGVRQQGDYLTFVLYTVQGNEEKAIVPVVTAEPTVVPTAVPTVEPTVAPTAEPTVAPTAEPTVVPTVKPTVVPTVKPTVVPTVAPTVKPTVAPTAEPTVAPTAEPTVVPTVKPTVVPTVAPTVKPTVAPTVVPTVAPTAEPTVAPTAENNPRRTVAPSATPAPTAENNPRRTVAPSATPASTAENNPRQTATPAPTEAKGDGAEASYDPFAEEPENNGRRTDGNTTQSGESNGSGRRTNGSTTQSGETTGSGKASTDADRMTEGSGRRTGGDTTQSGETTGSGKASTDADRMTEGSGRRTNGSTTQSGETTGSGKVSTDTDRMAENNRRTTTESADDVPEGEARGDGAVASFDPFA